MSLRRPVPSQGEKAQGVHTLHALLDVGVQHLCVGLQNLDVGIKNSAPTLEGTKNGFQCQDIATKTFQEVLADHVRVIEKAMQFDEQSNTSREQHIARHGMRFKQALNYIMKHLREYQGEETRQDMLRLHKDYGLPANMLTRLWAYKKAENPLEKALDAKQRQYTSLVSKDDALGAENLMTFHNQPGSNRSVTTTSGVVAPIRKHDERQAMERLRVKLLELRNEIKELINNIPTYENISQKEQYDKMFGDKVKQLRSIKSKTQKTDEEFLQKLGLPPWVFSLQENFYDNIELLLKYGPLIEPLD